MKNKIFITKKNELEKEEWYSYLYECPKCKNKNIWYPFNYCPNCGVKLHWAKEIKNDYI